MYGRIELFMCIGCLCPFLFIYVYICGMLHDVMLYVPTTTNTYYRYQRAKAGICGPFIHNIMSNELKWISCSSAKKWKCKNVSKRCGHINIILVGVSTFCITKYGIGLFYWLRWALGLELLIYWWIKWWQKHNFRVCL